MIIRSYNPDDYSSVEILYKDTSTFGGQFDEARDSKERLRTLIERTQDAILVAEKNGNIVGTVTIFEDGRSAWLYRFAVAKGDEKEVTKALWQKAKEVLKKMGHTQVLVYAPVSDKGFGDRYTDIGFSKGNDFTAYWQNLV
jgi:predicted N-acetyltransferase YhbS